MLKKENIKLFKMNECEWVAAESREQAQEWYLDFCGISEDDNPIDEVEEMLIDSRYGVPVNEADQDELQQNFEIKTTEKNQYVLIPFTYELSKMPDEIEEPWIVASTEY